MNTTARRLVNVFVTGLLAALPLLGTLALCVWVIKLLYGWLGPDSFVGDVLAAIGLGVTGSEVAGYGIGVLLFAGAIFLLGLVVDTRLSGLIDTLVGGVFKRIPLVGSIYDMIQKFIELLSRRDAQGTKSMSPVWLRFGGPGNVAVLALLAAPDTVDVGGDAYIGVIVPTAPVPVGGALLYVPREWVTPAPLGMEALTSIYVSMGVTAGEHLQKPPAGKAAG